MTDKAKALGEQPAFPCGEFITERGPTEVLFENYATGLTKREWLAGMAMQGLCAKCSPDYKEGPCNSAISERAIILAEMQLEQLAK